MLIAGGRVAGAIHPGELLRWVRVANQYGYGQVG
jgi:hypothetical protein